MPSPWDDKQKPNERAKDHGKRDAQHGPHEKGLGARKDPKDPQRKKLRDLLDAVGADTELIAAAIAPDENLVGAFPSYWYQPNVPPVRDQGDTPKCVAFSNGYGQAHIDRPEAGRYLDFDEAKFFTQIGGSYLGAYMSEGLKQRKQEGYPVAGVGNRNAHRIADFYDVALTVNAVKAALTVNPLNGDVLMIGPWYQSWFHPFASGKLPAPDYVVGGHGFWIRGWNDNYGFRLRNSWGTDWGRNGDAFLPYSHLSRMWDVFRTKDR